MSLESVFRAESQSRLRVVQFRLRKLLGAFWGFQGAFPPQPKSRTAAQFEGLGGSGGFLGRRGASWGFVDASWMLRGDAPCTQGTFVGPMYLAKNLTNSSSSKQIRRHKHTIPESRKLHLGVGGVLPVCVYTQIDMFVCSKKIYALCNNTNEQYAE